MAFSFSSSKTLYLSSKLICLILVISLLVSYDHNIVEASRFGRMMIMEENQEKSRIFTSQHMKVYKKENAYEVDNLLFTMLPKGVPIPPSAPSKRHNAIEDSTPQN
ncbi:hypothetical protein H5410_025233 [Solanum commersonii]|uniref:Uncharacterized protein n=1 Tax=Solanum commersonii TaxID=4109 RepID=A0A9J5YV76_SOLCO|nr:hypothetical protein H5410_025233 [Solanum commersonii]